MLSTVGRPGLSIWSYLLLAVSTLLLVASAFFAIAGIPVRYTTPGASGPVGWRWVPMAHLAYVSLGSALVAASILLRVTALGWLGLALLSAYAAIFFFGMGGVVAQFVIPMIVLMALHHHGLRRARGTPTGHTS